MIQSFGDKHTRALFDDGKCHRKWRSIERAAIDKIDILDAAETINDLRAPPGNRLKALLGNWKGWHQIRINDQYRIRFKWGEEGPEEVEIGDFHDEQD